MLSIPKLLILGIIIYAIYFFFIRKKSFNNLKKTKKDEEIMVSCEECKTFVSTKESIIKSGKYYCSSECAKIR